MKRIILAIAAMWWMVTGVFAQAPHSVLFTLGNETVTADEFVKVYQKTSPMNQADFSEKSLRDYLDLYVNFRLKVKEAKAMNMDTTSEVLNEFKTYRSKLTSSYMYDPAVLQQAYNRLQTDVHVEHILIKVDPNASAEDTMKALKRINNWRSLIVSGKYDFNVLAADSSGDPSAKENHGDLGFITAMQVIYPFETAAYNLKPGEISKPVRTKFGYHLIKVIETRPSRGTVTVQHIFVKVANNATEEDKTKAKAKIDSVYTRLQNGEDWDNLVKQYSEDKTTSANGGRLTPFGVGQMVAEFEDAAFALKNPNDYSQPVRTKFGWHIIRLIDKKPLLPYDQMKDDIRKKVENGPWKDYANESFINLMKKQYNFTEFLDAKKELYSKIDSTLKKGMWNDSVIGNMNKPLFRLSDKQYVPEDRDFTQKDFADYIEKNQRKFLNQGTIDVIYSKLYDQFVSTSCTTFEDARLEAKYPAFSDLMEEYMNGILLFDLSSDKVWNKAVEDTVGLKNYYEQHKSEWLTNERAAYTTYICKSQQILDMLKSYQSKGMNEADILAKINKKQKDNLIISRDTVEKGKNSDVEAHGWQAAFNYTVNEDSVIEYVTIDKLLPPVSKPLNEVKGYVVADYQEYLEKQWIADLRAKYPVSINEDVFKSLVKN